MTLAIRHGAVDLGLPEGMTFEEWTDKGRAYQAMVQGALWWAADWLLYGEGHYGELSAQAIAEEIGYARHTIQNAVTVAKAFPASRRREGLSFSHHADLVGQPREKQEEWLDRAESENWTRADLRREMGKVRALAEPDHKHVYRCDCGAQMVDAR